MESETIFSKTKNASALILNLIEFKARKTVLHVTGNLNNEK